MTALALQPRVRLPIVLLGLVAAAASLALMPRGQELAQMYLEAGDTQQALAILEARLAAGDRSSATIAAIARARAGLGDLAGAAQLLEDLLAERPRDAAVLSALADLQRRAGQTAVLIGSLERLQALSPDTRRLRELASLYGAAGRRPEQRLALRQLAERQVAEVAEYLALARLEAALGDPAAGAVVLRVLAQRRPQAVDTSIVGLELQLLAAAGQPEPALARARDWLHGRRDLAEAAEHLAGSLGVAGRPDLAVALLVPLADAAAGPRLVAALAQAESDAGDPAAALARLERLDPAGEGVPRPAALLRLRLALSAGEVGRAMTAAGRLGWADLPEELLRGLAAHALAARDAAALRRIAELGEARLAGDPVLAARLWLALGEREAAGRWSERAVPMLAGRPEQALPLAEVELALGRRDRAAAVLLAAIGNPALPAAALRPAAGLLVEAGQAGAAAAAFAALRRDDPSPEADRAWAIGATAAGQAPAVAAWLATPAAAGLPADLLQDLLHLAVDRRALPLALKVADRLEASRGAAGDRQQVIRLLLELGQPRRALDRLRALPEGSALPEPLREAVLLGAWRQGAPVRDEARAIARQHLAAAATPAAREAAIALLLELRAEAEALPVLRELAVEAPQRWLWAHERAAVAAGRRGEAVALWASLVTRPALPAELRRQLAFRLLAAGDKRAAEGGLRLLAAAAPPDSPDVRQLLYLWGPRPGPEALNWIEARARGAEPAERVAWMRVLTDRGAPARAVAVHRAAAGPAPSEAATAAWLAALEAQDDRAAMAAAVREALPAAVSGDLLRQLARLAERTGETGLEREALERLAATGGAGPETQRRLGVLAYLRRDRATAERLLQASLATQPDDYESWAILGDLATVRRDPALARQRHAEALRRLEAAGDRSDRTQAVRAHLLHGLGRQAEAARLYEALLAARPRDRSLRADYVAMLVEQGAVREARAALVLP